MINSQKIMKCSPSEYAAAAVVAKEVGEQMLARLDWMTLSPKVILDVGSGTGYCSRLLKERYPLAKVVAIDNAYPMLQYAKQQESAICCVEASAERLPFADSSIDLIFANLLLPWCSDVEALLREWRRVLRPEGLLMFTSFGPDTLQDWRDVLADITLPDFVDMHVVGDELTRNKFADPVLDVDYLRVTYRQLEVFFQEMQDSGMLRFTEEDKKDLIEKSLSKCNANAVWVAEYEVVYGHAWGPNEMAMQVADEFGTIKIPLSHLRRRS